MSQTSPESELGEAEAKAYNAIKIRLSITGLLCSFAILSLFALTPLSRDLVNYIEFYFADPYIQFFFFALSLGAVFAVPGLLLDWYGGYFIEHIFALSNQTPLRWLAEQAKSTLLGFLIGMPLSVLFFFLIRTFGVNWWWVFATAVCAVSVLLAKAAPSVIFPLFYKFTPLGEGETRSRIAALLAREKVPFGEIFSFNMSRNTKKANAGFAGVGKSRRIILSDTLLDTFTPEEIEVIFAHELGHLRGRHIFKNMLLSCAIIYLSFFLCGTLYAKTLFSLGFIQIDDIAAIPALLLYLSAFGLLLMPATNAVSRFFEREADRYAIRVTGGSGAFISAMEKLAAMNLADREPRPVVEFLFHSHPSIFRRIEAARKSD